MPYDKFISENELDDCRKIVLILNNCKNAGYGESVLEQEYFFGYTAQKPIDFQL